MHLARRSQSTVSSNCFDIHMIALPVCVWTQLEELRLRLNVFFFPSMQVDAVGAGGDKLTGEHDGQMTGLLLQMLFASCQSGLNKDATAAAVCRRLSGDFCSDFGASLHHLYVFDDAV